MTSSCPFTRVMEENAQLPKSSQLVQPKDDEVEPLTRGGQAPAAGTTASTFKSPLSCVLSTLGQMKHLGMRQITKHLFCCCSIPQPLNFRPNSSNHSCFSSARFPNICQFNAYVFLPALHRLPHPSNIDTFSSLKTTIPLMLSSKVRSSMNVMFSAKWMAQNGCTG